MKAMIWRNWIVMSCVVFQTGFTVCSADVSVSKEELLTELIESEQAITSIEARLRTTMVDSGIMNRELDWGYAAGREYFEGTLGSYSSAGKYHTSLEQTAFDGEKQYYRRANNAEDPGRGAIREFSGIEFSFVISPNVLMGFGAVPTASAVSKKLM